VVLHHPLSFKSVKYTLNRTGKSIPNHYPLAMKREAVLDRYFNDITVEKVESENEAWGRLKEKPRLWSKQ
jgi:hypothetical protein